MTKHRTIQIGVGPDGPVKIDVDILLRTRAFVSASSGGGKSHTLRRLIEQLCPMVQCIVLDWEGEFSTLRKKFPFVLVGEGGETPAHPHTAAQVAITLLKLGASAICDLYELRGNGRHEFVRNFINAMVNAPKELWHPVVVIIDEAHYLCPENGYGESVAKDAIIDLCNLGRKRGFCAILASQRASKVSKNATEPLQNFFIGLTMPDDQKRICDVFKVAPGAATREFSATLEALDPGEFFVRGAAISKTPILVKVGNTDTQPPPTGSAAAGRRTPTPDAIKKLLPQLEDIPVEAERKAQTEKQLRDEILALKKELRVQPKPVQTKSTIDPERERMLLQQITELQKTGGAYEAAMRSIAAETQSMLASADHIKRIVEGVQQGVQTARKAKPAPIPPTSAPARHVEAPTREKPAPSAKVEVSGVIASGERKVLEALATLESCRVLTPSRSIVAALAGYSNAKSGGFTEPTAKLVSRGLIESSSGTLQLTDAGRSNVTIPDVALDSSELQERVMGILSVGEKRILTLLIAAYPEAITRERLSEGAGYSNPKSGGFTEPVARLAALGFAETPRGSVRCSPILWVEA